MIVPGASLWISKQCDVNITELRSTQSPYFASLLLNIIIVFSAILPSYALVSSLSFVASWDAMYQENKNGSLYYIRTADSRNQQKGAAMAGTFGF